VSEPTRLDDPRLPPRFWAKVSPEPNTGCWLWAAASDRFGYGRYMEISPRGAVRLAHRVSFIALTGFDPGALSLDHLCRTPACVNPAHLEPVTHGENVRRGVGAQRTREAKAAITHCPKGHRYDDENTYRKTLRPMPGRTYIARSCRACQRIRDRARRAA
jgi:uncharacterized protein YlaI